MVARRPANGKRRGTCVTAAIEVLMQEMEQNITRAEAVSSGLDDSAFNWRPGPHKWSIAQCLEHLCLINEMDLPHLDRCIAEARRTVG